MIPSISIDICILIVLCHNNSFIDRTKQFSFNVIKCNDDSIDVKYLLYIIYYQFKCTHSNYKNYLLSIHCALYNCIILCSLLLWKKTIVTRRFADISYSPFHSIEKNYYVGLLPVYYISLIILFGIIFFT